MELQSQNETTNGTYMFFRNSIKKSAELAVDKLKRMFLPYPAGTVVVENEDKFVVAFHGQRALHDAPTVLISRCLIMTRSHSFKNRYVKESAVGLQLGPNHIVLTEMLNWANKYDVDVKKPMKALYNDLVPARAPNGEVLPQITTALQTQRQHRQINWQAERKYCTALEVCQDNIIIGWGTGQIKIYSGADLQCKQVFNYCEDHASVTCLQCTCTELIAAYDDGKVCVWSIESGTLVHTFCTENKRSRHVEYATCMRLRNSKLVVGTDRGTVKIWQFINTSFTLLGSWNFDASCDDQISYVNFNDDCVVLQAYFCEFVPAQVKYFNGQNMRSISRQADTFCLALHKNRVITGGHDKVLQIREIITGMCVMKLQGHEDLVVAADANDRVIASGDFSGLLIIWLSAPDALEGMQVKLASFTDPRFISNNKSFDIKLGPKLLAIRTFDLKSRKAFVMNLKL